MKLTLLTVLEDVGIVGVEVDCKALFSQTRNREDREANVSNNEGCHQVTIRLKKVVNSPSAMNLQRLSSD